MTGKPGGELNNLRDQGGLGLRFRLTKGLSK